MSTVNILKTTLSSSAQDITGQLDYEILFNASEVQLDIGFVVILFIKASAEMTKGVPSLQQGSLQVTRSFNVRPGGNSRVVRSDAFTLSKASLFASGIDAASLFNNANAGLDLRLEVTPEPCASQASIADQRLPMTTQPTMALQFDGVNNYIESYCLFFPLETRSTVEMWVRGGPQDTCLFYATCQDRSRRQISAHLPWSDGNVYFDKGGDAAGNVDRISKKLESTSMADTWNHWAFVRDESVGRMAIYKNGVLWHEASGMSRGLGGCTYFMIGADGNGNARYKGAICEVRIWCSARTEAQIKDNMNRRIPGGDSMLIASYALDQATTTITDRSGDGRHGALRGSVVLVPGPPSLITTGSGSTASPPPVIDTTDDLKGTITARGENGSGEAKEKLFDNQKDSKWLDFSPQGSWVQYTYAAGIAGRLTGYTLTSANDAPERDPADWQLQGSNDGGATWVAVDTRTGVTFGERLQKQTFTVSGSPTYKAYRLNITKVSNPSSANCVQLAEIELLGQQVSA